MDPSESVCYNHIHTSINYREKVKIKFFFNQLYFFRKCEVLQAHVYLLTLTSGLHLNARFHTFQIAKIHLLPNSSNIEL